jgi:hypothetical protein
MPPALADTWVDIDMELFGALLVIVAPLLLAHWLVGRKDRPRRNDPGGTTPPGETTER